MPEVGYSLLVRRKFEERKWLATIKMKSTEKPVIYSDNARNIHSLSL